MVIKRGFLCPGFLYLHEWFIFCFINFRHSQIIGTFNIILSQLQKGTVSEKVSIWLWVSYFVLQLLSFLILLCHLYLQLVYIFRNFPLFLIWFSSSTVTTLSTLALFYVVLFPTSFILSSSKSSFLQFSYYDWSTCSKYVFLGSIYLRLLSKLGSLSYVSCR